MPGTNEYSMAPELRADYTETAPALVSRSKAQGKVADAVTGLPQIYKMQAYDPTTFDEAAFADTWFKNDYGSKASKGDARKFNKFKNSEEYIKALADAKAKAKAEFDASENKKWQDSYKTYSEALATQHRAKVGASTQELKDDITKLDMNPKLKPKWSATRASVDSGATTYKVQAGNTLGQIVADYNKKNPGANLKWQDVAKWSGIADPSKMRIGHVINFADPTQAAETVATPVQPTTPPTPVVPPNPIVTPADTVAVTAPKDTVQVAAPRDTVKTVAVDTSKVSQPVDTAKTAAADTAKVALRDTARVAPADTAKTVAVDSTQAVSSPLDTAKVVTQQDTTGVVEPFDLSEALSDLYYQQRVFDYSDLKDRLGSENVSQYVDPQGRYYTRYDPDGRGDFYVDRQGYIYNVKLGGGVGSRIYSTSSWNNATRKKNFDTLSAATRSLRNAQDSNYRVQRDEIMSNVVPINKRGGTMNRINYFQQGGAAPQQQDLQQQIIALVQAAMQGDKKATETVNKIMEAAKAGDQQAVQLAQMIQQVVEQMKGQATAAKWGAKLGYIKSLKYAKGGKACPACEKGKQIEMKACGGKKAKKRYFGGLV